MPWAFPVAITSSAGSVHVFVELDRCCVLSLCCSIVEASAVIATRPVRIKVCKRGMFPPLFVNASAYIPRWSTHLTWPFWASRDERIICMSMAVLLSLDMPDVSLERWSYRDLASQIVRSSSSFRFGSADLAAHNKPRCLVLDDQFTMSNAGLIISS